MQQKIFLPLDGEGWQPVETTDPILTLLNSDNEQADSDFETFEVTSFALSFYRNTKLYRIQNPNDKEKSLGKFFICDGENATHLDGTSPPIHTQNAKDVNLNKDNALDYLIFFGFFVRGEEGPFFIIDEMNNPLLPQEFREPESEDRNHEAEEVHRLYRPPQLFGTDDQGRYRASAMIYYSNAIFLADFLIDPTNGMVEMLDDEPLLADLSVRANTEID